MSKIYEALLRAEMDRVAQLNGRPNIEATLPSLVETEKTVLQSDSVLSKKEGETAVPAPPAPQNLPLQVPVSQYRWKPDQRRLPALDPRGTHVEQIRALRSRMHELRAETPLKTVLVSSGLPEEGKSFVAANLAVALSGYYGSRVLLIDGDMRRGTLHKLIGTHDTPGLMEYLGGTAGVMDVIQQAKPEGISQPKGLATLSFIPCGADADNAADLSGNGRFEQLLSEMREMYDWIIVDSSPVNLVTDGANLARVCDGVILVTRGGVTKYETAQRAVQELKAAKLLGVVLNAVEGVGSAGGYYGYDR